jgi:hypothetical protein
MAAAQDTFTVHPEYENFIPGTSKLIFSHLIPYRYEVKAGGGLKVTILFYSMMLVVAVAALIALYATVVIPFMLDHYSQKTTGQVIDCRMKEGKNDNIPVITYAYRWNDTPFINEASILGRDRGDCSRYRGQSLIVMLLPSQPERSFPTIAQSDTASIEQFCIASGLLFLGGNAFFFLGQGLYTLFLYRRAKRIYADLQQGILLEGRIEWIKGYMNNKPHVYLASIVYSFETPAKRRIKGWAHVARGDTPSYLPPAGTPVTVLYANDHAYTVL